MSSPREYAGGVAESAYAGVKHCVGGGGRLTDSDLVLDSTRHDDISHLPLRLDISLKVRLDEREPLLDASLDISSSLSDIS